MISHLVPGRRLRSIGWVALLGLCTAVLIALSFRVNALKSEVRLAEKRIISLKREKLYLETEFETRASQQQLKAWNDVEFGYVAPGSSQYLENERELAALGKLPGPDAPRPIRVASADDAVVAAAAFPQMIAPLASSVMGKDDKAAVDDEAPAKPVSRAEAKASLAERLTKVDGASSPAKAKDKADKKQASKEQAAKDKAKSDTKLAKADAAKSDAKSKPAAKKDQKPKDMAALTRLAKAEKPAAKSIASGKTTAKLVAKNTAKPAAKPQAKAQGGGPAKKEARR